MDIKRHDPPHHQRLAGEHSPIAAEAYQNVIRQLFQEAVIVVREEGLDQNDLTASLDKIIERGDKYREGS
jgi:dihydroxyacetone kinase DhaKLM complex PTS-EIIA-like component DhaM